MPRKAARKIEDWDIDKLSMYETNPRTISDQAVDKVAASIAAFGFNSPILVSKDGTIAAGHTRLRAARKLMRKTVPVIVLDLTDEQVAAFRIADNKTAEFSSWEYDLLREELMALDEDVRLDTGFDEDELERLFNDTDVPSLDELEKEFGDYDDTDGWPKIEVRVAPDVKEMWESTLKAAGHGDTGDSVRLDRVLHCVDMSALRAYAEAQ